MLPKNIQAKAWPIYALVAIIADQISKLLFLRFGLATYNKDLAFSVLADKPLLINASALLIFALGIYYWARKSYGSLGYALVVGGGLSNILDRIFRQGVVDFIDIEIWPSFNLADAFITIGAALILYTIVRAEN